MMTGSGCWIDGESRVWIGVVGDVVGCWLWCFAVLAKVVIRGREGGM